MLACDELTGRPVQSIEQILVDDQQVNGSFLCVACIVRNQCIQHQCVGRRSNDPDGQHCVLEIELNGESQLPSWIEEQTWYCFDGVVVHLRSFG